MPRYEVVVDSEPEVVTVVSYGQMTKRGWAIRQKIVPDTPPRRAKAKQEASSSKRRQMDVEGPRPPQLKVLRTYAKLPDSSIATALPPTVYFSHTQHTLTIFDAYPKALFHFLILPRLSSSSSSSASDLTDLRTLLRRRARAEETLRVLADEATRLRGVIAEEMMTRYGFVWDVWAGFHAVPSME